MYIRMYIHHCRAHYQSVSTYTHTYVHMIHIYKSYIKSHFYGVEEQLGTFCVVPAGHDVWFDEVFIEAVCSASKWHFSCYTKYRKYWTSLLNITAVYEDQCECCPVKPVYNDHSRDQVIVVSVDRWSLYRGTIVHLKWAMTQPTVVSIDRWSLYASGL